MPSIRNFMIRSDRRESHNKFLDSYFLNIVNCWNHTQEKSNRQISIQDAYLYHDKTLQSPKSIFALSDSNMIRTHNHLVHKWTLNNLAKLAFMIELCC